jgi:hypothetical protein
LFVSLFILIAVILLVLIAGIENPLPAWAAEAANRK